MKETLKKNSDSAEQQTTQRYYENKNFYSNHDRRGLKAGIGIFAAGAVLIAGGYGVSKFNAEAEPAPGTSTEDVIDQDPTAFEPIEEETGVNPETLSVEDFEYTLNGEKYVGIDAFSEALAIPTTPVDEYPGTFSSEERNAAIQEEYQAELTNWVELADQFINYEFAEEDYSNYNEFEYTDSKGRYMVGVDAIRALYVAPAFEKAMLHDSNVPNTTYPSEFMEDLIYTASRIDNIRQYTTLEGETPYEAHLVIDDMQFGGVEIVGHDDYEGQSVGIAGGGTVTLRLDTNQGEGNTAPFDLLGGNEEDVDYFSTTDPVTLRIEANGGTGQFKVTDIELR